MLPGRVRCWGLLGLLTSALGCAGPAAESKPVVAPSPTPNVAAPPNHSQAQPELDPEQPEYWASHVAEPERFKELFQRLEQFVTPEQPCCMNEDADNSAARKQANVNGGRVALPLTQSFLSHAGRLDAKQRAHLLFLLVKTHDPRVEPAVRFALSEFVAGRNEGMDPNELRAAVRGVSELQLRSCRDLLLPTYLKLRGSTPLGSSVWFALARTMIEMADASWLPALQQKLAEPMVLPEGGRSFEEEEEQAPDEATDAYADQMFWQLIAVRTLGQLRLPGGMDALVSVLPDPAKKEIRYVALAALVGYGRLAFDRGLVLLSNADERQMWVGGLLVGGVGLAEGTAPLLQALRRAKGAETKARLALELPRLPANPDALAAFQRVFEKTPSGTSLRDEPGDPHDPHDALDALADAASSFQDSSLVPWQLLQVNRAPGNSTVRAIHQSHLLFSAMELATPAQWPSVAKAVAKFGSAANQEFAKACAQTLAECGDDLSCYLKRLDNAAGLDSASDGRYIGLKAAHRVAQLGNAQTAEQLALAFGSVRDPVLASAIARVIDHLLPQGSASTEEALTKLFALAGGASPTLAVYGNEALVRLRARAAPTTPP